MKSYHYCRQYTYKHTSAACKVAVPMSTLSCKVLTKIASLRHVLGKLATQGANSTIMFVLPRVLASDFDRRNDQNLKILRVN